MTGIEAVRKKGISKLVLRQRDCRKYIIVLDLKGVQLGSSRSQCLDNMATEQQSNSKALVGVVELSVPDRDSVNSPGHWQD